MKILKDNSGFSLIELITVMALSSILIGIAVANLRDYHNASQSAGFQIASFLKRARAEAIATTSAVRVRNTSSTRLVLESAVRCSDETWTQVNTGVLTLSDGAELASASLSICFNSRGFSNQNIEIPLIAEGHEPVTVEVLLGGGVEIVQ